MFKFDEYPEIKKAYREHNRLKRIVYSLEKKIRPDDKASVSSIIVPITNVMKNTRHLGGVNC